MTYILRPATVSDAEAICSIYNPYVLNTTISFATWIDVGYWQLVL